MKYNVCTYVTHTLQLSNGDAVFSLTLTVHGDVISWTSAYTRGCHVP